jgi:hypothetical protein
LYDPPDDANCDGTANSTQDEFVEIVNRTEEPLLLDALSLSDGDEVRHVWRPGTVLPAQSAAVVFGGGAPTAPGTPPWHCGTSPEGTLVDVASSGRLSLSNTGDTLSLRLTYGDILDTLTYTSTSAQDQSLVRWPEMELKSAWMTHEDLRDSSGPHSPGRRVDGRPFTEPASVPEDTGLDTGLDTGSGGSGTTIDTAEPVLLEGLIINEVMADPGDLDANCDGTLDTIDDEYIEIVNTQKDAIDLSGATLSDEVSVRHVFGEDAWLAPAHVWVIFSAGTPTFDGSSLALGEHCIEWPANVTGHVASTGTLALNNLGDTLWLEDSSGTILASVSYGSEANDDQSLTRDPDLSTSSLVQHTLAGGSGRRLSPGTRVDGSVLSEE